MDELFAIRPMTPGDLDAVVVIAASLPEAPHWPRSGYESVFAPRSSPQRIGMVAEAGDSRIAGFLVASLIPPQAELESIAVAIDFQRCGLARQLFDALSRELRSRNCSEVLLEVRPSNRAARALYTALGFAETARRPVYYANPSEDAILMSRPV
jgi:[ribosomal protein S18]-alanine N-acetyltransferase